jgi:hypothetical protein
MDLVFDDIWLVLGLNRMRVYIGLFMLAAFFVIPADHKWSIIVH